MHNSNALHSNTAPSAPNFQGASCQDQHYQGEHDESPTTESASADRNGHELDYNKVVSPKVLLLREELQYEDMA